MMYGCIVHLIDNLYNYLPCTKSVKFPIYRGTEHLDHIIIVKTPTFRNINKK